MELFGVKCVSEILLSPKFRWVGGFPKELVNEPFFGTQICFRYKSSLSYFIANAIICNP